MVLYLIGLGLGDEKDITLKGLEAIQRCALVFLEHYTAVLAADTDPNAGEGACTEGAGKRRLEALYGKPVVVADREMVESQAEMIIGRAKEENVAFLVVGDPFAATTHHDLLLRAAEEGVRVETIHNASIMNAVAQTGLQLYQFGQTVSLCFFRDNWRPDSFYPKVLVNTQANFHTLCLLDIKVKEQSFENLAKGVKVYEPPRYMSIRTAIEQLLEVEEKRQEKAYTRDTKAFGVARLGQASQQIVSGTLAELLDVDFGAPLHSLVLAAPELHELELAMFEYWHWDKVARGAKRKAERVQREAREAAELAERLEKMKAEDAARPAAAPRSTVPKAKAPVKASASAPVVAGKDDSDDDDGAVMEPLF